MAAILRFVQRTAWWRSDVTRHNGKLQWRLQRVGWTTGRLSGFSAARFAPGLLAAAVRDETAHRDAALFGTKRRVFTGTFPVKRWRRVQQRWWGRKWR